MILNVFADNKLLFHFDTCDDNHSIDNLAHMHKMANTVLSQNKYNSVNYKVVFFLTIDIVIFIIY